MEKNPRRWFDVWAAFFLLAVVWIVVDRLVQTEWTADLEMVRAVAVLGLGLGLALGQSRFYPSLTKLMAFIFGLFFIPVTLGITLSPGVEWRERLLGLVGRVRVANELFFSNQPVPDPILFLLLMSILYFFLAISAGYYLSRYAATWQSFLPFGVVMLVINHYDRAQPGAMRMIGLLLFAGLLLLARLTFVRNRAEWQQQGIYLSPEASINIGRASAVVGLVVVLLAFTIPVSAASNTASTLWTRMTRPFESVRERFSDAFTSLKSNVAEPSEFYGDRMALGNSAILSDEIIFSAYANKTPPEGQRYYWKVRTYDQMDNGIWGSTITERRAYDPDSLRLPAPEWLNREEVEFTFAPEIDQQRAILTSGIPFWFSRPGSVTLTIDPDGTVDIGALLANPPIRAGEFYRVRATVADPTITELRESSTDYPQWIMDRYLEVSPAILGDIQQLAGQITAGASNPYDKAQAITQYLRNNIEYSDTVPDPPAGKDPLLFFLFESKRGYCNYYASAEIMMLRSLGIPARMAVGYAQGQLDEDNEIYVVRQRESHAWPEVYFEGYGWVEFEPTVSQPERTLALGGTGDDNMPEPTQAPSNPAGGDNPLDDRELDMDKIDPDTSLQEQAAARRQLAVTGGLIAAGLVMGLVFVRFVQPRLKETPLPVRIERTLTRRNLTVPDWLRGWSRRSNLSPFEKAYLVIGQILRLLGRPAAASETPSERTLALSQMLPEADPPSHDLLDEYQRAQYSPYPADLDRAKSASSIIRRMGYKAFFRRLLTNRS